MSSRSEKPQRSNPHQLALRQHVFPARSIERFAEKGGVDLLDLVRGKRRSAGAKDSMFCADRAWNHGAETGFMKDIEDKFQALADRILSEPLTDFSSEQTEVINEFFGLWRGRADRRSIPVQRIRPGGEFKVGHERTQDDLELLEKHNVISMAPDGTFAFRDFNGSSILLDIGRFNEQLEGRRWAVIRPLEGEFCVPDVPMHGVIPMTPKIALVVDAESGFITRDNLARINARLLEAARDYVFARSLAACPGITSDPPFA